MTRRRVLLVGKRSSGDGGGGGGGASRAAAARAGRWRRRRRRRWRDSRLAARAHRAAAFGGGTAEAGDRQCRNDGAGCGSGGGQFGAGCGQGGAGCCAGEREAEAGLISRAEGRARTESLLSGRSSLPNIGPPATPRTPPYARLFAHPPLEVVVRRMRHRPEEATQHGNRHRVARCVRPHAAFTAHTARAEGGRRINIIVIAHPSRKSLPRS